ncbi:hypothetical protein BHR79_08315 [Methanohalophilus halophilus]|nr:hypothetical protein BHR79_08315 [Methanohalophilus halophilus]RNI07264.1 hypothetical protein EFE40_10350 [Methanohalophilus halophilus]
MYLINQPETKFEGDTRIHNRKYIDIDEQELDVVKPQTFLDEEEVRQYILDLTPEDAKRIGIKHRSALAYLKKKAKEGGIEF